MGSVEMDMRLEMEHSAVWKELSKYNTKMQIKLVY